MRTAWERQAIRVQFIFKNNFWEYLSILYNFAKYARINFESATDMDVWLQLKCPFPFFQFLSKLLIKNTFFKHVKYKILLNTMQWFLNYYKGTEDLGQPHQGNFPRIFFPAHQEGEEEGNTQERR